MTKYDNKCLEMIGTTLEAEVKKLMTSGAIEEYLDAMSRFNNYSFNNLMLIRYQMPTASRVCSASKWAELGGHIRAGTRALRILAPIVHKKTVIVDDREDEQEVVVGYRAVNVFDESQIEGATIPEQRSLCKDLEGDILGFKEVFGSLQAATTAQIGWMMVDEEPDGCHGYYNPSKHIIRIRPDMSQAQTIKTCIHEIAHSLLHSPEALKGEIKSRSVEEMEAECTAYVVCRHFGLDTSDYSLGYVATWGYNLLKKEKGWELFHELLKTVLKVSKCIIDAIDPPVKKTSKTGTKRAKKSRLTFVCVGRPASSGPKKVGVKFRP